MGINSCGQLLIDQGNFFNTGLLNWDTTAKTANFTAVNGNGYFVNTTSAAITVTLPAGSVGDIIAVSDYASTSETNYITISPNGTDKINGTNDDYIIIANGIAVSLLYVDSTRGWKAVSSNSENITGQSFITATGGTITTSGDYKIHTFTSPGTFTVCSVGNPSGSDSVDYLVIAGGGGAGSKRGGGGGAGGFRESVPSPAAWSASPLANPGGSLPVSVQGYPITVGAGGAGQTGTSADSTSGANSVFSTITSTGGGRGNQYNPACSPSTLNGQPGGSGGGSGRGETPHASGVGGNGNTPSVSPPQGFDGGATPNTVPLGGGGGGGATAVGETRTPSQNGTDGGAGGTSSISGSSVTRGGGGAGGTAFTGDTGGTGGSGGGGPSNSSTPGTNGTANTGGGGGGGHDNGSSTGGTGGSGVVIIRYKFQ